MLKNLFLFFIILSTWYTVTVFKAPELANQIEKTLWINWLNQFIIDFKNTIFWISENLPDANEIIDIYNNTLSWAIDTKNKTVDWVNTVKEWIDSVRVTLSWANQKYNEIKKDIDNVKQSIDSTVDTISKTADIINDFSDTVNSSLSWSLNN